jgi:methylthioribose-1-phosphate isomerase
MAPFRAIEWIEPGTVRMLDQRLLPHETRYNDYQTYQQVAQAITDMVTRGAPCIGVAAAYGMVLVPANAVDRPVGETLAELEKASEVLSQSRPTAVNLFWALKRMKKALDRGDFKSTAEIRKVLLNEAQAIAQEDIENSMAIARNALPLIPQGATIIHHCNTGALGMLGYGTALGIIRLAHEEGKKVFALVDETRPRLQGGRLTSWELLQYGVPFQVIADSASGFYMRTRGVDLCVVGADRVAANGDTANKIGTYNLAVVAHENGVPFYVAVPLTTIDLDTPTGDEIAIEERPAREVTHIGDYQITPEGTPAGNPAFDVTPAKYITALITEKGAVYPPYEENIRALFED